MALKSILLLCVFFSFGFAHPHIFIDTKVTVEKEKIIISWIFDEMTSSVIIADYDKNKNKTLEQNEVDFMEKDHFKPLATYNFFSAFVENTKESKIKTYTAFGAFIEKGKLHYQFEIPKPKSKIYEIHFYDPEMYVAMIVNKKETKCYSGATCKVEGYDADFYYGYKVSIKE